VAHRTTTPDELTPTRDERIDGFDTAREVVDVTEATWRPDSVRRRTARRGNT